MSFLRRGAREVDLDFLGNLRVVLGACAFAVGQGGLQVTVIALAYATIRVGTCAVNCNETQEEDTQRHFVAASRSTVKGTPI
jgi:hypothetical protein